MGAACLVRIPCYHGWEKSIVIDSLVRIPCTQGWKKLIVIIVIDCDILYFLFIECTGAFTLSNEYGTDHGLVFTFFSAHFDIPYLILFVQVT